MRTRLFVDHHCVNVFIRVLNFAVFILTAKFLCLNQSTLKYSDNILASAIV